MGILFCRLNFGLRYLKLTCSLKYSCPYPGDLLDEFEEAKYNPLWTMKGYTQIFHSWRESKRCQSVPLSSACTYVMLPWWAIINTVLEHPQQPLLTF